MTAKRWDLTKKGDEWVAQDRSGTKRASAETKVEAVKAAADAARAARDAGPVRIHKEDGKFEEERAYPRSADPCSSKG